MKRIKWTFRVYFTYDLEDGESLWAYGQTEDEARRQIMSDNHSIDRMYLMSREIC